MTSINDTKNPLKLFFAFDSLIHFFAVHEVERKEMNNGGMGKISMHIIGFKHRWEENMRTRQ